MVTKFFKRLLPGVFIFSLSLPGQLYAKDSSVKETDIFNATSDILCLKSTKEPVVKITKKKIVRFAILKKEIKKIKNDLNLAQGKAKRTLKKQLKTYQALLKVNGPICASNVDAGRNCTPSAISKSVSVNAESSLDITLTGSDSCGLPLTFSIVQAPQSGYLGGTLPNIRFTSTYRDDSFVFRAANGIRTSDATVTIRVNTAGAFSGNPESLEPYTNRLTEKEVRHLLSKVAYGGSDTLVNIGVNQGLDALVDALLDIQDEPALEKKAAKLPLYHNADGADRYELSSLKEYWLAMATKSAYPLRWKIAEVLYHWYPTDLGPYSNNTWNDYMIRDYSDFLLGRLASQENEYAGTYPFTPLGNFKNFIIGLGLQPMTVIMLSNQYNSVNGTNLNEGREFLEVATTGASCHGVANYNETDVAEVARALTGFTAPSQNGIQWFEYVPQLHDFGNKTVFVGKPWEANDNFDRISLTNYVLDHNPESARYVASRFFTSLLYPDPSDDMRERLAQKFRDEYHYEIKPYLRDLLRSQAMFSSKSYKRSIRSAFEQFVFFMRVTKYPLFESIPSGDTELRFEKAQVQTLRWALDNTSFALFQPKDIFGLEPDGVNRTCNPNFGAGLLSPSILLMRLNGTYAMLAPLSADDKASYIYSYTHGLLPNSQPTADDMVNYFTKIFTAEDLTPAQKDQIKLCFTTLRSGESAPAWDPTKLNDTGYQDRLRRRIGCALTVSSATSPSNMK